MSVVVAVIGDIIVVGALISYTFLVMLILIPSRLPYSSSTQKLHMPQNIQMTQDVQLSPDAKLPRQEPNTTQDLSHRHNGLTNLPFEIILEIARHLDKEYQVLLSLCCKTIHHALHSSLDLSLHDLSARVNFLHHLELDHPEFLTCRSCGWMFLWQKRQFSHYSCPRQANCLPQGVFYSYICSGHNAWHKVWVRREVVDLVFRGLHTGLPITSLNSTGVGPEIARGKSEARWVDGRLLLEVRHAWDNESWSQMKARYHCWGPRLCAHQSFDWRRRINEILDELRGRVGYAEEMVNVKCLFCHADFQLRIESLGRDERIKIDVAKWYDLGSRDYQDQGSKQIFTTSPTARLDTDSVLKRDLQSLFASGQHSGGSDITCDAHLHSHSPPVPESLDRSV